MNKEQQKQFLKTIGQFIAGKFEPRLKALESAAPVFEYDGERTFRVSVGGEVQEFSLPVIIDRGVFSDTKKDYARGDAVSSGGSLWIAQRNAPDHKPGEGDGWRLAVKRGRDAS